jgi:hypothetical protein
MVAYSPIPVSIVNTEPRFLGESGAFWVQTGVLAVAAIFAFIAIVVSRRVSRRQAAIEAIFSSRRDEELIKAIRQIAILHGGDKNMAAYAKVEGDEGKYIRYALNHYEYVSVGISQGIYDEKIFKSSSYTTMVSLYDRTKPFIDEVRNIKSSRTIYQEFECLACRWKEKPLKHKPVKTIPK